ncbi:MgtC/SapB family protein [Acidobacteriota bacterium]
MNALEIILKLLLAVALGGLVGMERESSQKPAGFRTNILICLGSTMVMILAALFLDGTEGNGNEMARIAAGVITGIGFIGAGTIIQARGAVIGLTSAATLWTVAVLGLVIGFGYYLIAIIYTGIIILTLIVFRQFEGPLFKKRHIKYQIKTEKGKDVLFGIKKIALHEGLKFREITVKSEAGLSQITFSLQADEEKEEKFNRMVMGLDHISEIKID